jgi:hypothetical protein
MIEAAWLLAAVELNGALISRGANVRLTERECMVESRVMAPAVAPKRRATTPTDRPWITAAHHCSYSPTDGLLRIRLPQDQLAQKTLTLGDTLSDVSVAMLHDASVLAQHPDYASQPPTRTIPAAALDTVIGSNVYSLGGLLTHGPWSLQSLVQRPRAGRSTTRSTIDYLFGNGAHIRGGDFRTDSGPEQRFGEYRGVLITNRAAPLRGNGKAEAQLAIESPSKVQFFDRNGVPVYASEILAPGNYQIQGFGASTLPGFLEARLIDINGVSQSVTLPWSADRRLLSAGAYEWEIFSGQSRDALGQSQRSPATSGTLRHGIHPSWTVGGYLERAHSGHRQAAEISSRAMPNVIATAAVGQSCNARDCQRTWLAETRSTIGRSTNLLLSTSRQIGISPTDDGQRHALASLTGALQPRLNGTLQFAHAQSDTGVAQTAKTASLQYRIGPSASLQIQARHQKLTASASAWSGFVGVTVYFSPQRTSVSAYLNTRSSDGSSGNSGANEQLTLQASTSSGRLYGPQFSLAHTESRQSKSDAFFRYASPYGDGSLRADTTSQRLNWSGSTRLWLTSEGLLLTPVGEDNVVVQKLGLASVLVRHSGRDSQISGDDGRVIFRKAPPWTDSSYTIDPRSVPFGVNLATSRVRIPLATNRAYVVDYRGLWSTAQAWRIARRADINPAQPPNVTDRFGKDVYLAPDGFVDLRSGDQLPLSIRLPQQTLYCHANPTQPNPKETLLLCQPTNTTLVF